MDLTLIPWPIFSRIHTVGKRGKVRVKEKLQPSVINVWQELVMMKHTDVELMTCET